MPNPMGGGNRRRGGRWVAAGWPWAEPTVWPHCLAFSSSSSSSSSSSFLLFFFFLQLSLFVVRLTCVTQFLFFRSIFYLLFIIFLCVCVCVCVCVVCCFCSFLFPFLSFISIYLFFSIVWFFSFPLDCFFYSSAVDVRLFRSRG